MIDYVLWEVYVGAPDRFQIGVQVFVVQNGNVLLGRRSGIFGSGTWGLPGGRLRKGETILEAASRELFEETGLIAKELEVICLCDAELSNVFQLQVGVQAQSWEGKPKICEPDKCNSLAFFPLEAIPEPLFVSSGPLIKCFQKGKAYITSNSKQ